MDKQTLLDNIKVDSALRSRINLIIQNMPEGSKGFAFKGAYLTKDEACLAVGWLSAEQVKQSIDNIHQDMHNFFSSED